MRRFVLDMVLYGLLVAVGVICKRKPSCGRCNDRKADQMGGLVAATAAVEFAESLRAHADHLELPADVDELAAELAGS